MDLDISKRKELVGYSRLFKALSDENRLRMIELVAQKEYCATELHEKLGMGQSVFSHHMKKLTDAVVQLTTKISGDKGKYNEGKKNLEEKINKE